MNTDMTTGSPGAVLWRFSIPLLLSVVFQQLYNIVDSIVAGQFVGVDALAAVGASYPVTMIFMAFATGCNIGCSVIISQLFGAKDFSRMKTAVSTALLSICTLALLLTVSGLRGCTPLMLLLGTPQNIFTDAMVYLNIYLLGLLFLFVYNICTGVFAALGDSRTPLFFLIASSLGNIFLDLFFVISLQMGVAGVAWATFIAQGISSVLALYALLRRLHKIETKERFPLFSGRMLGRIAVIAVPSILQQSFVSVGNLFIQGLVNGFGATVVAGYAAAIKLNTFAITSFSTISSGVSNFTAQNLGGRQLGRVTKGYRSAFGLTAAVTLPFIIAFVGFPRAMMGIFLDASSSEAVVEVGVAFLRIVAPFYLTIAVKLMTDGVLRGAGAMGPFMFATFFDLIVRVVLSFVLADVMQSPTGIWLSWPIGWVSAMLISLFFYWSGGWKKKFL